MGPSGVQRFRAGAIRRHRVRQHERRPASTVTPSKPERRRSERMDRHGQEAGADTAAEAGPGTAGDTAEARAPSPARASARTAA